MTDQAFRAAQISLVAVWMAIWVYFAYLLARAYMHRRPGSDLWRFFGYRQLGKYPLFDESFTGAGRAYYRRATSCGITLIVLMAVMVLLRRARIDTCRDVGGRWNKTSASCESAQNGGSIETQKPDPG